VFEFWIDHGVRIFRVDNPHTKPYRFWEWCLADLRSRHPDTLFLSEAFTRPAVMYRLAKLGFSQSYTYFPWRNGRDELASYGRELAESPVVDFFRPNHWPNTPDILHASLQQGGRGAFASRLILAATLGTNYGIYGPPFETFENRALREGSEEYLDSEKYQIRNWKLGSAQTLRPLITRINRIRRENPALQQPRGVYFHPTDNERLIAYSKTTRDHENRILCVVNLDPKWKQAGFVDVHVHALGLEGATSFEVHDLVTDARYRWRPGRNYVEIDPLSVSAHIFDVVQRPKPTGGVQAPV
jgi:starch synthase (maltosyl-transferring)